MLTTANMYLLQTGFLLEEEGVSQVAWYLRRAFEAPSLQKIYPFLPVKISSRQAVFFYVRILGVALWVKWCDPTKS